MEKAQIYRGIEFVRISDLPKDQKDAIGEGISDELIIKILKEDDQLLSDCIQYKHYVNWFNNVYSAVPAILEEQATAKPNGKVRLAWGR